MFVVSVAFALSAAPCSNADGAMPPGAIARFNLLAGASRSGNGDPTKAAVGRFAAFVPGNKEYATLLDKSHVNFWDVATGKLVRQVFISGPHHFEYRQLSISKDAQRGACLSILDGGNLFRLDDWDLASGRRTRTQYAPAPRGNFRLHPYRFVLVFADDPDELHCYSPARIGTDVDRPIGCLAWNLANGTAQAYAPVSPLGQRLYSLTVDDFIPGTSPDGLWRLANRQVGSCRVQWMPQPINGKPALGPLPRSSEFLRHLAFVAGGTHLAAWSGVEGEHTPALVWRLDAPDDPPTAFASLHPVQMQLADDRETIEWRAFAPAGGGVEEFRYAFRTGNLDRKPLTAHRKPDPVRQQRRWLLQELASGMTMKSLKPLSAVVPNKAEAKAFERKPAPNDPEARAPRGVSKYDESADGRLRVAVHRAEARGFDPPPEPWSETLTVWNSAGEKLAERREQRDAVLHAYDSPLRGPREPEGLVKIRLEQWISLVRLAPDGRSVAVFSPDGLRIFDVAAQDFVRASADPWTNACFSNAVSATYSADGRNLATLQQDYSIYVWDLSKALSPIK